MRSITILRWNSSHNSGNTARGRAAPARSGRTLGNAIAAAGRIRRLPCLRRPPEGVGGREGEVEAHRRVEHDAVERLVDLIREHGKWVEPEAVGAAAQ